MTPITAPIASANKQNMGYVPPSVKQSADAAAAGAASPAPLKPKRVYAVPQLPVLTAAVTIGDRTVQVHRPKYKQLTMIRAMMPKIIALENHLKAKVNDTEMISDPEILTDSFDFIDEMMTHLAPGLIPDPNDLAHFVDARDNNRGIDEYMMCTMIIQAAMDLSQEIVENQGK